MRNAHPISVPAACLKRNVRVSMYHKRCLGRDVRNLDAQQTRVISKGMLKVNRGQQLFLTKGYNHERYGEQGSTHAALYDSVVHGGATRLCYAELDFFRGASV